MLTSQAPRLILSLALAALVGCGTGPRPGVVELRYMAWGNPEQQALEERLCQQFSHENPGIEVKFLRVPVSAYRNKMVLMLASHTAPDVMRVDHYYFANLADKEYFLDLTPFAKNDPEFHESDFIPTAIEECKWKGRLYALEVLFGGVFMSYNKTLVRQAGLEDPFVLWKGGEWTWAKFREYASEMTKRRDDGHYETFGARVPGFPEALVPVRQFGGDIMDSAGRVTLAEPKAMRAWNIWHSLQAVDHSAPNASQTANSAFSFESGRLGMEFSYIGTSVRYREVIKDFDWDVCPVPAGPVTSATIVKGNQIVISAESKHPNEAWRFVRFMTSDRVEHLLCGKLRRCCPTRIKYATSKEFLATDQPPYNTETFSDVILHGRILPITTRWSEWADAFTSPVQAWIDRGEGDGILALKDGERQANRVLSEEEGL